jgi:hypothetical protein
LLTGWADGPGGEYASALAAEVVQAHLSSTEGSDGEPGDRMAEAISLANLRVWEDALQDLAVGDLSKKSAELVAIAHERGAPDNVTLCFLAVGGVA